MSLREQLEQDLFAIQARQAAAHRQLGRTSPGAERAAAMLAIQRLTDDHARTLRALTALDKGL